MAEVLGATAPINGSATLRPGRSNTNTTPWPGLGVQLSITSPTDPPEQTIDRRATTRAPSTSRHQQTRQKHNSTIAIGFSSLVGRELGHGSNRSTRAIGPGSRPPRKFSRPASTRRASLPVWLSHWHPTWSSPRTACQPASLRPAFPLDQAFIIGTHLDQQHTLHIFSSSGLFTQACFQHNSTLHLPFGWAHAHKTLLEPLARACQLDSMDQVSSLMFAISHVSFADHLVIQAHGHTHIATFLVLLAFGTPSFGISQAVGYGTHLVGHTHALDGWTCLVGYMLGWTHAWSDTFLVGHILWGVG